MTPMPQPNINRLRKLLLPLIQNALEEATRSFMDLLPKESFPAFTDIRKAESAALAALKQHLFSKEWINRIAGNDTKTAQESFADQNASFHWDFDFKIGSLAIPSPQKFTLISPIRIALIAACGAIMGMIILTPLARLLMDMRDTGLFIGAPLGAALLTLASWKVAELPFVRRFLFSALGVAAMVEVWLLLSRCNGLGNLWKLIRGKRSWIKRAGIYLGLIFILICSKRDLRIDRQGYEETVRGFLAQWIDEAIVILVQCIAQPQSIESEEETDGQLCGFIAKVQELPRIGSDNQQAAIQELLLEIRNMGFKGVGGETNFIWDESMESEFEKFGHIEAGDMVVVERQSVRRGDVVEKKGLVRKHRQRN